jgi:Tfp pilus assembly protein PilP
MKKLMLLIGVSLLCGCKPSAQTDLPELHNPQAVLAWVNEAKKTAMHDALRTAQAQTGQLLGVALAASNKNVFVLADAAAPTAQMGASDAPAGLSEPAGAHLGGFSAAKSVAQSLSDAQPEDIVFSGTLMQGAHTQALVKVSQHLYIVNVGDVIGQGAWRVLSVNAQSMQLQVGKKAITYAKN